MRMMGCRALALGLGLAVIAPLAATTADAAVVICQKKNKLKLRIDACAAKETQVPATELGVTGPEGPTNLVAAVRVNGDGSLSSSHAAAGLTVTTSQEGASYLVTISGTGAFTGLAVTNFILNATAESSVYGVANAYVDSLTDDSVGIYVYPWISSLTDGSGDLSNNPVFLTVYRGANPPS